MSVKRVLSFNHLEECKPEFSHDNEFKSFDIKADNTRSPPPRLIRPKIISTSNLDVCIEPDIIHSSAIHSVPLTATNKDDNHKKCAIPNVYTRNCCI